ncbi:hypothetical protein EPUS_08783 [Endocarpon pusillum Z07020]|uniref:Zinc transporter n=1 Tax=Endocarpon pusillum (strain Z07020 / HMAS-L-300199) TaxID=1263415 RepID=U1HMU9_ENDPU|nr:uncharacterized protein EPUS_08783 [Endocarpon pusillum Z07020]ERF70359.1 hypothetical protein EPUS_08783 [Endocarpon pusillum Z07020]
MASGFTGPLISTVESSQHVHSHSRSQSHQCSSQRSARPFTLPRIPSERFDPGSINYDGRPPGHESRQKHGENGIINHVSFAANGSISAPSHQTNGRLTRLSKQEKAAAQDHQPEVTSLPHSYKLPRVEGKAQISAGGMDPNSRPRSYLRRVFFSSIVPLPYILLSYFNPRHTERFSTTTNSNLRESSISQISNDILISLMLTSCILLLLGTFEKCRGYNSPSYNAKPGLSVAGDTKKASTIGLDLWTVLRILRRAVGIAIPYIAALQLGGLAVSVLVLVSISSGLVPRNKEHFNLSHVHGWKNLLAQKTWTLAFSIFLCVTAIHYGSSSGLSATAGVLAVIVFTFFCSPPYLVEAPHESSLTSPPNSANFTPAVPFTPWNVAEPSYHLSVKIKTSPLIATAEETSLTLLSGALTAGAAGILYLFSEFSALTVESFAILLVVAMLTMWSLVTMETSMFQEALVPLATGLAAAILGNAMTLSKFDTLWQDAILGAMAYMAVQLDATRPQASLHTHPMSSEKHMQRRDRNISAPTKVLLQSTKRYSLLHGILADKDSRRIFYFMLLNLSFMLVQSTYGVLTGSLGLISDSIHMFFDCFALLVGLCAAVMSKWPPSVKYPYGYGKMDTLAGFGNGIFLMLISIEIIWEAIERLVEGSDVSRTMELLIVSSLGLGVNLVGIMAFEHGHAHGHGGHDHSHGGHSHSHASHAHDHSAPLALPAPSAAKSEQAHHHGGDNMYGIYLHIMADALGSVAVVISTLCVRYFGWSGFDPLASCAIAILIFASAVPLVFSSGKKLLLSLPSDVEYTLRDVLAGVSKIRGVVGYSAPKFWLDDIGKRDSEPGHEHHHHHPHENSHNHHHHHHHHHHLNEHQHAFEHSHSHHHDENNDHSHRSEHENQNQTVLGVIHIIASQHADLDDVRARVSDYLQSKHMDIVVQVERDGDIKCWCGGGQKAG